MEAPQLYELSKSTISAFSYACTQTECLTIVPVALVWKADFFLLEITSFFLLSEKGISFAVRRIPIRLYEKSNLFESVHPFKCLTYRRLHVMSLSFDRVGGLSLEFRTFY